MTDGTELDDAIYGAFDPDEQRGLEDAVLARLGLAEPRAERIGMLPTRRRLHLALGSTLCALAAASFFFVRAPHGTSLPPYRLLPPSADAALRGPAEPATGHYGVERELSLLLRPAHPTQLVPPVRVYAQHDGRLVSQPASVERDRAGALRLRVRPARDALARAGETWQLRVLVGEDDEVQAFELALPLD